VRKFFTSVSWTRAVSIDVARAWSEGRESDARGIEIVGLGRDAHRLDADDGRRDIDRREEG